MISRANTGKGRECSMDGGDVRRETWFSSFTTPISEQGRLQADALAKAADRSETSYWTAKKGTR
jgi:hypothetical protein